MFILNIYVNYSFSSRIFSGTQPYIWILDCGCKCYQCPICNIVLVNHICHDRSKNEALRDRLKLTRIWLLLIPIFHTKDTFRTRQLVNQRHCLRQILIVLKSAMSTRFAIILAKFVRHISWSLNNILINISLVYITRNHYVMRRDLYWKYQGSRGIGTMFSACPCNIQPQTPSYI